MERRIQQKRYFTLCLLLLLVLPQILLSTRAKSFSQQDGEENNSQKNQDEWRQSCEKAKEVCEECKNMDPECLKVEYCRRRQGEGEEEQDDHSTSSSDACAGVQVNDFAMNNFCAYCSQNSEKCEHLPNCEEQEKGDGKGVFDSMNIISMPAMQAFSCAKEGTQCSEKQKCCQSLTCQSDTAAGDQKRSTCQLKSGQEQKPGQIGSGKPGKPSGNGKPETPSGNGKPGGEKPGTGCASEGTPCQRIDDTSCCPGLSCEKSSNWGKPGSGYECITLVYEPIKPSSAPAENQCQVEGASCSRTGDLSCCPALSCESSSDLGTPGGPAYQCVELKSDGATTEASCIDEDDACAYEGDPSCCPELKCVRWNGIGIPGPPFQCVWEGDGVNSTPIFVHVHSHEVV